MKLPRDMDAPDLIKALGRLGYRPVRQTGSHVRLRCDNAESHSITIPKHSPLKVGTLAAIIGDVAAKRGVTGTVAGRTVRLTQEWRPCGCSGYHP